MSDELTVLLLVASRLDGAGIPYMVSGSMAMNYCARPRMTRDIDLVVELDENDSARIPALFPEFYCDPDTLRDAVRRKSPFNLIHQELIVKVDCIVRKDSAYRRAEFARRRAVTMQNQAIWIVTAEDLLLSKLAWAKDSHSEIQLGDVRNLIAALPSLDWSYVERWAAELTVTALLAGVRA